MVAIFAAIAAFASSGTTITLRAQSVEKICHELGSLWHLDLSARANIAKEPMILRFVEVEQDVAMRNIADALGAEWQKTGDKSFILVRTPALEKKDYQDHIVYRSKLIAKGIADSAKAARIDHAFTLAETTAMLKSRAALHQAMKQRASSEVYDRAAAIDAALPANRATARLLQSLDPNELATTQPFGCAVYSNHPTKMQFALPTKSAAVLETLKTEYNAMLAVAEKAPGSLAGLNYGGYLNGPPNPRLDDASRVTLKLSRTFLTDDLASQLRVYNAQGRLLLRADYRTNTFSFDQVRFKSNPAIQLSPESRLIVAALALTLRSNAKPNPPLVPRTAKMLIETDKHEPLSFSVSDTLIQAAEANGLNLIAVPDDDFHWPERKVKDGDTKLDEFSAPLTQRNQFDFSEDGWLKVTPLDKFETRLRRIDRSVMATYLKNRLANGIDDIESKGLIALTQPFIDTPSILTYREAALGPRVMQVESDRKPFRFWASLTSEQRSGLLAGGSMGLSDLSADQRSILEDWVFRSERGEVIQVKSGNLYASSSARSEPTTAFPDGLNSDFRVTAKGTSSPLAIAYFDTGGIPNPVAMNPMTLAMNLVQREYPDEEEQSRPTPKSYRVAENLAIDLRVEFEPDLVVRADLNDLHIDMSKPPTGFESLPDKFRQEVEAIVTEQREKKKRSGAARAGVKPPPP